MTKDFFANVNLVSLNWIDKPGLCIKCLFRTNWFLFIPEKNVQKKFVSSQKCLMHLGSNFQGNWGQPYVIYLHICYYESWFSKQNDTLIGQIISNVFLLVWGRKVAKLRCNIWS